MDLRGLAVCRGGAGFQGFAIDNGHHHQFVVVALYHFAGFLDGNLADSSFCPTLHDVFTAPKGQNEFDLIASAAFDRGGTSSGGTTDGELGPSAKNPRGCCLGGEGESHHS